MCELAYYRSEMEMMNTIFKLDCGTPAGTMINVVHSGGALPPDSAVDAHLQFLALAQRDRHGRGHLGPWPASAPED